MLWLKLFDRPSPRPSRPAAAGILPIAIVAAAEAGEADVAVAEIAAAVAKTAAAVAGFAAIVFFVASVYGNAMDHTGIVRSSSNPELSKHFVSPAVARRARPRSVVQQRRSGALTAAAANQEFEDFSRFAALVSPEDPNDWVYESFAASPAMVELAPLPEQYRTPSFQGPIPTQGRRQTCAAFTGAAISGSVIQNRMRTTGSMFYAKTMSPEFIYWHRENKPAHGMYGRDVFRILQRIGTVPEEMYPYRADNNAEPPNSRLLRWAAKNKIGNYARIHTVDGLKRALMEHGPCYLTLPMFGDWARFWVPVRRAAAADKGPAAYEKVHACLVVGWTQQGFVLRNTWSETWNGDGHTILPWEDWPIIIECWTAFDNPQAGQDRHKCSLQ